MRLIGLLLVLLTAACANNGEASDSDKHERLLRRHLRRRCVAVTQRQTSCGVIVTDGERLLLGHATRSPRWDIPKGVAEAGENFADAAARELREETGLVVAPEGLKVLGVHPYSARQGSCPVRVAA